MTASTTTLLDEVRSPADLRALPSEVLPRLAAEIRDELVATVTRTGGHLGPNLGVVELTIALHRVFDSPHDPILFDTGHQAYVHKMLTGRADRLAVLRRAGGLSGYPSRAESEHDLVENSHASTALSYADGLSKAIAASADPRRCVVAVVGDGALTGGMCWEALNNLGASASRPIVLVLNDNGRSYAPTVGGFASHLSELRTGACDPGIFTALGLRYLGPVDGHDIPALESALREARTYGAPTVVHCVTRKGHGYPLAECEPTDRMHTIGPARVQPESTSWTSVFAHEMLSVGADRSDVVGVTAAMLHPTGMHLMAERFPDRVYDVGIAEQHAVTSAAGLAIGGLHPVVAIYATFMNRAFDQVLLDVALHRLPVTFVLDRAGVTGSDGASHHGMWDLSLLGLIPGLRVAAPRDAQRLRALFREAVADQRGPTALRFPKAEVGPDLPAVATLGGADVLAARDRADVLLVSVGPLAQVAVEAARRLERLGVIATVVDPRWVLPVDSALIEAADGYRLTVTLEDNGCAGGYGDAFCRAARDCGGDADILTIALAQGFLAHGERGAILAEHGLDAGRVVDAVTARLARVPLRSAG